MGGLGNSAAHDVLILLSGHTERKNRVALRQEPRRQIRRPLTDHTQRNPVFATLFGDAKQCPLCRLESHLSIAWRVTMGLFANDRYRDRRLVPQGKIKGEAAENGHYHVHHFRRDPGEIEDRYGLAIDRNAEELGKNVGQLVAEAQPATEHKSITSIILKGEDSSLYGLVGSDAVGTVETAHRHVEETKRVRHAIGNRGVHCSELVDARFGEISLLGGQDCFAEYFCLLGIMIRSDYDLDELFEIEQPIRQIQAVTGTEYGGTIAKGAAVFIVGVEQHHMRMGIPLDDHI